MDVVKKKQKAKLSIQSSIVLLLIVLIVILIGAVKTSYSSVTLDKKDLLISEVKLGNLDITVDGYGKLVSEKLQLITALTKASVNEIVLKSGAIVNQNSIIVKLANPELKLIVESAEQELTQLTANLRQLKVNQKRELLTEQAIIAELQSAYRAAKIKREAEQELVKEGIVSELTFKQSQLIEEQLLQRVEILSEKLKQLYLVHTEAINIQEQRIKQQIGRIKIATNKLSKLHVRAGFDGVMQKLSVTLGQSIEAGQEIALIGSVKALIAEIKVPQNQASLVSLGQKVIIDTRQEIITGIVARISPIVEQNTVRIDVALPKILPSNTKPEQSISAEIIIKTLRNVTFINRPANAQSQSTLSLFKLNEKNNKAIKTTIEFGEKTGRYIEILSNSSQGDKFIISDLSNYQVKEITIN